MSSANELQRYGGKQVNQPSLKTETDATSSDTAEPALTPLAATRGEVTATNHPARRARLQGLWQLLGVPALAIVVFLFLWSRLSAGIETSLGRIPGPAMVWQQTQALWADHVAEREKARVF